MINTVLNEKMLEKAAKRLPELLSLPDADGYDKSLQALSQAFFNKSYEEVIVLLSQSNEQDTKNLPYNKVMIVTYISDSYLLNITSSKVDVILGTYIGTGKEVSYETLIQFGKGMLAAGNTIKEVSLPKILDDDYEVDDIIHLAEMLGHFSEEETIFECFDKAAIVTINNEIYDYWNIDLEYLELSCGLDDALETIIFLPGRINSNYEKIELTFTLRSFLEAKRIDGETNSWNIKDSNGAPFVFRFLK